MDFKSFEDQQLLYLLKEDNRKSFSEIYYRYWAELYNAAFKRTHQRELCRDAVQNIFADLWLRRRSLVVENLSAYLHTAVKYQVYKQVTRRSCITHYPDRFEEIINSPICADDKLKESEITQLINLWLAALPQRRKEIFLLHYKEQLSTTEIAEKLGLSRNTIQAQLYTAYKSLRSRMNCFVEI